MRGAEFAAGSYGCARMQSKQVGRAERLRVGGLQVSDAFGELGAPAARLVAPPGGAKSPAQPARMAITVGLPRDAGRGSRWAVIRLCAVSTEGGRLRLRGRGRGGSPARLQSLGPRFQTARAGADTAVIVGAAGTGHAWLGLSASVTFACRACRERARRPWLSAAMPELRPDPRRRALVAVLVDSARPDLVFDELDMGGAVCPYWVEVFSTSCRWAVAR